MESDNKKEVSGSINNGSGAAVLNTKQPPPPNHDLSQRSAWLPPTKPRTCPHVEAWLLEKDWEASYTTVRSVSVKPGKEFK